MSDVDDELLALAGGDVSSDEEERSQKSNSPPGKRSASATAAGNDNDDDDDDDVPMNVSRSSSEAPPARKGSSTPARNTESAAASARGAASKKAAPKKAKRRAQSDDESEEEGEASSQPGSPASLQSAPMDESDSDSEAEAPPRKDRGGAGHDDDNDENKYPVDGLFMTHEEKEEIMGMREVEREQILAERAQEKDRIHQNKLLRQLVSNDEQRKKRSASDADLDEGQRKTSRVRTKVGGTKVGEVSSAMDTLKTRRAEKNERNRLREEDRERRKDRGSSPDGRDGSDGGLHSRSGRGGRGGDEDGDSEVEWAKSNRRVNKSRSPEPKESQTPTLHDIERVRLSRSRFGQVCFYPGFERAIIGTFVRISIGPDPETRQPVYRMAIVKGFTKGRPYAIPRSEGPPIVTDQYVLAAHGKAQREWPFISCSDSAFTESEWARYQKICHVDSVALPKKGILLNKADDINKLISRPWTEQELEDKVSRQQKLKNQFNGVDRMKIEHAMKEAQTLGNMDKVRQLQEELDNLETPRLAFRTSLTPAAKAGTDGSTNSQQERLAKLNAENRRRNAEEVRKAQLRERARIRAIERRIERGEDVEEDHSRRVKTRAKFVHDMHEAGAGTPDKKAAGSQAGSGTDTPGSGTPQLGAQKGGLLPSAAKLQQKTAASNNGGLPTIHRPLVDDDIIGELDLDIDESILD